MTSKEALERYYSNLMYGNGGFQTDEEELEALSTIKQALERLEVLEEIHRDDTKLIKELQRQLNMYKVNYYRLDDAVIELIDKFKIIKGSDKNE